MFAKIVDAIAGWFWRVFISIDEFANVLIGGPVGETISTRAYKAMIAGETWGCVLCRILDVFQKDHCLKAYEFDSTRPV